MDNKTVRFPEMIVLTGLSRTTINERMNEKSPRYAPDFPKSFNLDGRAIGWDRNDVLAWLEKCKNAPKKRTEKGRRKQQANNQTKTKKLNVASSRSNRFVPELSTEEPTNLAEAVMQGSAIIAKIQRYLDMDGWTPAMGAMLLAGVEPPEKCIDMPDSGVGLDGKSYGPASENMVEAKRLLRLWNDYAEEETVEIAEAAKKVAQGESETAVKMEMSDGDVVEAQIKLPTEEDRLHKPIVAPAAFMYWCQYNAIETKWLPIYLGLIGCSSGSEKELASTRAAMMMSQTF